MTSNLRIGGRLLCLWRLGRNQDLTMPSIRKAGWGAHCFTGICPFHEDTVLLKSPASGYSIQDHPGFYGKGKAWLRMGLSNSAFRHLPRFGWTGMKAG